MRSGTLSKTIDSDRAARSLTPLGKAQNLAGSRLPCLWNLSGPMRLASSGGLILDGKKCSGEKLVLGKSLTA